MTSTNKTINDNLEPIMNLQELFSLQDDILQYRLEHMLPTAMNEANVDMWIVIGDEYNEGPAVQTFLPAAFFHARRTAMFMFVRDSSGTVKRFIISKPDFSIDSFYTPALLKPRNFDFETFYTTFAPQYDLEEIRKLPAEDNWECLSRMVKSFDPKRIAIDSSETSVFSDGLSKSNWDKLMHALGPKYDQRTIAGDALAIRWMETKCPKEFDLLGQIVAKTRQIIARCYSKQVITPGVTTLGEARFFMMERGTALGMPPWFEATLWARRPGHAHIEDDDTIILPGDLLHCDVGFLYGGLCSDIQEMAYVSNPENPDEDSLLAQLNEIHSKAMRFQDIVMEEFQIGITGNEVLSASLKRAKAEGIDSAMLYSHPTGGRYGHGPGPSIGQFTNQKFIEGSGELPLRDNTAWALELNVREPLAAWNNLTIMWGLEMEIFMRDGKTYFPAGRQSEIHII